VAAARAAFTSAGDTVPLESIARDAGVGIGTLYRHFPTRESLVEAVYAAELDEVTSNVETLLDQSPPEIALRAWMDRYARFIQTKRGMLTTLRASWASGRIATPTTRARVSGAIRSILSAGVRTGAFRANANADDVTTLMLGVFLATASDDDSGQVARLLDLVVDAVRAPHVRP
jgi:AcrR family transcriptional regulator